MIYVGIIVFAFAISVFIVLIGAANPSRFRQVFCVPEGWAGLLYRDGLYVRRHNAGRKVVWGFGWTMSLVDLRKTSLLVAGQEIVTANNVGLKFDLLVTYEVEDPVKAAHATQHWRGRTCTTPRKLRYGRWHPVRPGKHYSISGWPWARKSWREHSRKRQRSASTFWQFDVKDAVSPQIYKGRA